MNFDHNLTHIYHHILEMTKFLLNKLWNLQHSKMSKLFWNCNLESKQMWSRHKRRYCRSYNKTKELFQYSLNKKSFVTSSNCQNDVRERKKMSQGNLCTKEILHFEIDCMIFFQFEFFLCAGNRQMKNWKSRDRIKFSRFDSRYFEFQFYQFSSNADRSKVEKLIMFL